MNDFLPTTAKEMCERGWQQVDFVLISADAYVDHPSFGAAVISRVLTTEGYRVGIIAQPDWRDPASVRVFGRPRLAFLISGGNMDSLVNHYTVAKKRRHEDAYSPGGMTGLRPDRAVIVYGNLIRQAYRDAAVIAGGIEASLRRLAHYDYWSDSLKRSVLLDSQADLLVYGMGERAVREIASALAGGLDIRDITYVNGTVYRATSTEQVYDALTLPSFDELRQDKTAYARSFMTQYDNTDPVRGKRLIEPYGAREFVVQNPPAAPLDRTELDAIYALPYTRRWHPMYDAAGGIPALAEVKFSLTSCRGCFGGCSFCALTFHQGRIVQSRSQESLLAEARLLIADPEFKGYIHDVGGPTANFRHPACAKQGQEGTCRDRQCLFPAPCPRLRVEHRDYLQLLRRLRELPGVKKVFIRSGLRYDYLLADADESFFRELCRHHVSGRLKIAPEHVSAKVLHLMGKPQREVYERFAEKYRRINAAQGQEQFVEPYFMSSHPGCGLHEAVELAEYLQANRCQPQQTQDFYPTPSTISTCMYYTGLDPRTMRRVYVERSQHNKALQRALINYRDPANHALVKEALIKANRTDLIGCESYCLIRPRVEKPAASNKHKPKKKRGYKGGAS